MTATPPTGRARVPGANPPPEPPSYLRPSADAPRSDGRAAGGYGGGGGYGAPVQPAKRKIKPRWGRIAMVVAALLVLVLVGLGVGGLLYVSHVNGEFKRVDAFSLVKGQRPAAATDGSENILLLGSDSRDDTSTKFDLKGWRTDTIILMHVNAAHDRAYLISIPRDSWLHIPQSPTQPKYGNTDAKINAAFSWGGVPLTVQTIEEFTHVRIDHTVLIDFSGFAAVTDALGGVDLYIDRTITSIHKPHRVFTKGTHHFTGAEALDYVRQRYQFPDGDLSRVRHQQAFLKAILTKATSSGTLTNPFKLSDFVGALTKAIIVDKDFSLLSEGWTLHGLAASSMTFLTSPTAGFATEPDGESAVAVDTVKAAALYAAVKNDSLADYLKQK
jgi:LCP family protein required for cell wall assembly